MNSSNELRELATRLRTAADIVSGVVERREVFALRESAETVGKSWSGSWLGYHARIYYKDFEVPPPGAHFNREWGLQQILDEGTTGEWYEYSREAIRLAILEDAGKP